GILYFIKEKNRSLGLISCVIALASVMINTGYGLIRIAVTEKADSQKTKIKVAAIQGNISSLDKWNNSLLDGILDKYIDMTYEAADKGAQLIVYPESAMNYYIKSGEGIEARTRIRNICKEYGITAVIGAFDCGYNLKKEFVTYNALVTFYPDGSLEEFPYYKRHLVPFGEYVPMERVIATLFPFLADLNMFEEQLTPGDYAAVCDTEYGKLGRMICFDSIYETTALESIRDGAEILIVSTNDSWYLDSPAATIHNSHSQLRAIESGRYLIRAANTGISSVINANGIITEQLGTTKEGILYGEVSFMQERTLYSYVGDSFMFVTFALIINGIVYKVIKNRKGDS
ncbi:MAG: apolipoprotein N-acyltransferase, partial [Clostridia bacterium]|nr:apolipoprotein N-acyltransferase [Clostridia bacterium]